MRILNQLKSLLQIFKKKINQKALINAVEVITAFRMESFVKDQSLGFDRINTVNRCYRINIITSSTSIHGMNSLLMIAQLLSERGHHVKLIRKQVSGEINWFHFKGSISDIHFNENTSINSLENSLPNADILMTYGNCEAYELLANLSSKKGIKVSLFMYSGARDNDLVENNSILKEFKLLATTRCVANEIKNLSGVNVDVANLGVHSNEFYPVKPITTKFTIGTLYRHDDSLKVIAAYRLLKEDFDVDLLMFGQVETPDLDSDITYYFSPDQEKLRIIYSSCHIWVTPDEYEDSQMCGVQAILCGTPLVTSDVNNFRDFLNTDNCIILESKSPSAIANAIRNFIRNSLSEIKKFKKVYNDIRNQSWARSINSIEEYFNGYINNYNPSGYRSVNYELTIGISIQNELKYVKQCIESIKRSTKANFQLVLVDNNNDEETQEYLTILDRENNVKYLRDLSKYSLVFNCNEILRHANGKYICLLHSDTIVTQYWDLHLIEALKVNSKLGIVGPSTSYGIYKDNRLMPQQLEEVYFKRFDMSTDDIDQFAKYLYCKEQGKIELVENLNGFCIVFDRSIIGEIGFFGAKFDREPSEEVVDFGDKLRLAGYTMGWVKFSYVHHFGLQLNSVSEEILELSSDVNNADQIVGIENKRIGFIYNSKLSSSTRKRTFEVHKYIQEYVSAEVVHWQKVDNESISSWDIIILQRIGGLSEIIDPAFLGKVENWIKKYPTKKFYYDLDDYIILPQNQLPKKLIKICNGVIVSTNKLAKLLVKYNQNVIVLPNGVDYERFEESIEEVSNTKSSTRLKIMCFSLAGAGVEMLNELGSLLTAKNINHEVELYTGEEFDHDIYPYLTMKKNVSLDILFKELNNADYLVNWGEHSIGYFEKLVKKYDFNIKETEHFIDAKSALKYYNAAISKTVLLTTEIPFSYSEIVRNGVTGFYIKDAKEAFDYIMKLENDSVLKERITNEAFYDVVSNHSLNATSKKYLNFFISR